MNENVFVAIVLSHMGVMYAHCDLLFLHVD